MITLGLVWSKFDNKWKISTPLKFGYLYESWLKYRNIFSMQEKIIEF